MVEAPLSTIDMILCLTFFPLCILLNACAIAYWEQEGLSFCTMLTFLFSSIVIPIFFLFKFLDPMFAMGQNITNFKAHQQLKNQLNPASNINFIAQG